MSKQATLSSDQFDSKVTPLDSIEHSFKTVDGDAYRYKTVIELDEEANSKVAAWYLKIQGTYGGDPDVDRTTELLDHLNADGDEVLSVVLDHTDLRTTKVGSGLGWVLVDTDGDIIGFDLVEAYPNAPSVKIAHEELVEDLRALNPE
ncbi:hypothetical protein [Halobacteriaceae bacterium SHR40]|uniref:hypothetical protein n=1 Tax=Halovenus amylolytica TaxID=2500550 RepID=UPI000FE2B91B